MAGRRKKEKPSINRLCKKCTRKCKQEESVILVNCPHFEKIPKQLEFSFDMPRGNRKKNTSKQTLIEFEEEAKK